jgi:hypothetical protein
MEAWIEVNIDPGLPINDALLTDVIDGLVHAEFGGDVEAWFYFWEPSGLRLRIRWLDPGRGDELNEALGSALDREQAAGNITEWYEGAHGERGKTYAGEANFYGQEVWPQIQKDWMNGSELALLLLKLEKAKALSKPVEFWERHVHLFSNQLYGYLEAEIQLCLRQACGYLRSLENQGCQPDETTRQMIERLASFLE